MRIKKYSSDLSAKHWQVIEKMLISRGRIVKEKIVGV
jgi:hypothetical protein